MGYSISLKKTKQKTQPTQNEGISEYQEKLNYFEVSIVTTTLSNRWLIHTFLDFVAIDSKMSTIDTNKLMQLSQKKNPKLFACDHIKYNPG